MSPKKIILLLVALLLVALLAHRLMRPATHAAGKSHEQIVPVEVANAQRGDIDLALQLVGRVEAWSTVTLRARVSGQLQALAFEPGARVHKGQLLIELDTRLLQAQLDQARGSVARDRAQLQKAQADQQRYADMLAKGFVSKADFDTYKANLAIARANLQSDQAAQAMVQTQLQYACIDAPFDGVIGSPLAWPGAQVTADSTDLAVLNQIDPVRVTFNLPEASLAAVRSAQARGPVTITAMVPGLQGAPRQSLRGTLQFIDNTVDPATGTIVLKARFDNPDAHLTPGQFVQVTLPTTRLANVVSVPVPALQTAAKGDFVFVLGHDGTVSQRYVSTGPVANGRMVISKGLATGEQVVTEGQMLLVDGARARVAK